MYQGTTPTYVITVKNYNLEGKTVYVTLASGARRITLTGDDLAFSYHEDYTTIAFRLTQEQTNKLEPGDVEIQVKFIDPAGIALATVIEKTKLNRSLLNGVIQYKGD